MSGAATTSGDLRCASWSRAARLDPVGTAGAHRGYLLVDLPLPWPADIGEIDEVVALGGLLAGTGVRLQARVPEGERRVALYRFAGEDAPAMQGRELAVGDGPDALADACGALLAGGGEAPAHRREVLLCTHGRRDLCCGSRGAALHLAVGGTGALGPGTVVRRTSHTGGHRFAPTAIVLPEATSWAYLDASRLAGIVARSGPIEALVACYRGWSGLAQPPLQALERAVLARVGWELLDAPRTGRPLGDDRFALSVGGGEEEWIAAVRPGRRVPRPDCGASPDDAVKHDTELVVDDLRLAAGVRSSQA